MVHDVGMINRKTDIKLVQVALKRSRVVALLGPRQCGKTTLARQFVPADSLNYFDLEDPAESCPPHRAGHGLAPAQRVGGH